MGNFYSRWTDKEMEDVVLPIIRFMGLPAQSVQDCRRFDTTESESSFMHMSLPKEELVSKINHAITLYYRASSPRSIEEILNNWSELSSLDEQDGANKFMNYINRKLERTFNASIMYIPGITNPARDILLEPDHCMDMCSSYYNEDNDFMC